MSHVYKPMIVTLGLGYSDTGSAKRRKLRIHGDEYLIDAGVDEDRILAVFGGSGDLRAITFPRPFNRSQPQFPVNTLLPKE